MTPPPDDASWLSDGWKVAQAALTAVIAILAWLARRATARLDALEKSAVTKEEFSASFAQMRDDRKANHTENQLALRRIEDKLDETQPGVMASRLNRAEVDITELRAWKQQMDQSARRGEP